MHFFGLLHEIITSFRFIYLFSISVIYQSVSELETKIQSMLRSTIRNGIATVRLADHLNERLLVAGLPKRETNFNAVIDTGKQCTVSGIGKMYDQFLETGVLKDFTGWGTKPALSQDSHFAEAPLRLMTFADTYGNNKYKESMICSNVFR